METSAFEILMESVLKMASLMDVSAFVLVENRNNQRRYQLGAKSVLSRELGVD